MEPLRPESSGQRATGIEPDFFKMLLLSVVLHLLLLALYFTPWFQQSLQQPPPVYQVSLVNAPVLNPQAGRPEAVAPTEPEPAPADPSPAPPPPPAAPPAELEPEPEAVVETEPEPEPEPELVPLIDELEEQRLAEEKRRREEAERLAAEQRQREEAEKKRLAEEKRQREEAEKRRQEELEARRRQEEAQRQQRIDELAARQQREADERARQERLDALRAEVRRESRQIESPVPDAPVGMPDGRGTEAGISPSAFVREYIQGNWSFAGHQALGNPEAEVYLLYNAAGSLISHRFIRRSGNTAFDESLVRAVSLSRQLPQPLPQTMEFNVVFNLKELLNR